MSNVKTSDLIENCQIAFTVVQDGHIVYVNQPAAQLLGYETKSALIGMWVNECIHPDDRNRVKEYYFQRMAGRPAPEMYEVKLLHSDGSIIWAEARTELISFNGKPATQSALINITERKLAQAKLEDSRERYRSLVELNPAAIVIHQDGIPIFFNPASVKMLGAKCEEELAGLAVLDFIHPDYREHVTRRMELAKHEESHGVVVEEKLLTVDGRVIDVELAAIPTTFQGKHVVQTVFWDVTERKRAELLTQRQRDLSIDLSSVTDIDNALRISLDAAISAAGLDSGGVYLFDEQSGDLVLRYSDGLSTAFVESIAVVRQDSSSAGLVRQGIPYYGDYNSLRQQHQVIDHEEQLRAIAVIPLVSGGTVIGCLNIASHSLKEIPSLTRNVLEGIVSLIGGALSRIISEQALGESEEQYRTLVDNMLEGLAVTDAEGNIILANRAYERIFDAAPDGMIDQRILDYICSDDIETFSQQQRIRRENTGSTYEMAIITAKGNLRKLSVTATPRLDAAGNYLGAHALVRDITEQKQYELRQEVLLNISASVATTANLSELLAGVHKELGRLIDVNNFFIALWDESQRVFTFPYVVDEYYGDTTPDPLTGSITEMVYNTEKPLLIAHGADDVHIPTKYEMYGPPAESWLGVPLRVSRGIIGVCVVQDYKKREQYSQADLALLSVIMDEVALAIEFKRTEDELRLNEATLAKAQEIAHIGNWEYDRRTKTRKWSAELFRIFGLDPASTPPTHEIETNIVHPEDRDKFNRLPRLITSSNNEIVIEYRIIRPDREERTVLDKIEGVLDESGNVVKLFGVLQDITERKQMEESIIQQEREESILTIAGGIAHDFNNLLMGVMGNVSLLRDAVPQVGDASDFCDAIIKSSQRMADLTKQLMTYAGGSRPEQKPLDVNHVISDTLEIVRGRIPDSVKVNVNLSPDLWSVQANTAQLSQVLLNLVINATEAMPVGGKLSIRTSNQQGRASWQCPAHSDHPAGDYIYIEVKDSGHGMDQRTLSRIFEPFFSTKFQGRGLGLAATIGIIRSHNGCISATSEPGVGTTFHILLPRGNGDCIEQSSSVEERTPHHATVLVADNEDVVLSTTQNMLTRLGHDVLIAKTSEECLACYREHADEISIVVLDALLPLIDGKGLFDSLLEINPSVHAIVVSGHSHQEALKSFPDAKPTAFLKKPFTLQELRSVIRLFLDENQKS